MHRILLLAVLLTNSAAASAQTVFVAPTSRTIVGRSEQSAGPDQAHILIVSNESTVPIIVFGVTINQCENVRQWCAGQRTKIAIAPGTRRNVGRVEPKNPDRSFVYRWSFSYHADSSDLKALEALRVHGIITDAPSQPRIVMRPLIDTSAPPGIEKPLSRERLTPEERGVRGAYEPRDTAPAPAFRFKVAYGSILGSTMMPGAPIQLTGPCINPAESARYEKDAKITRTPWRPPVLPASFSRIVLPLELKDSVLKSKDVLIRFVADSTGDAIPESASVLESPHGSISVNACKAAIAAKATPARDKAGNAIRAWVQMPVTVGR